MQVIRKRADAPETPHAVFTLPASPVVRMTVRGLAAQQRSAEGLVTYDG